MKIRKFHVVPSLPEPLLPLEDLAYNLRWSWDPDTVDLFRRLDRELWESAGHNPVLLLGRIRQERLVEAAQDESFLSYLARVVEQHRAYMLSPGWFHRTYPGMENVTIAYFSAEFGVSECLPIYSGGLGVLAGDHLKSASDMGLPLAGVGLLYQKGYFHQYLNQDGWQQESTPVNDFFNMPVRIVRRSNSTPVSVAVDLPGRLIHAQVWRADVGRVPLYLLDSNLPENQPQDREITDQLYGGDTEKRICQEILLGVGGLRALAELGIYPQVCHMNEGHSAFLALERIRRLMEREGLPFEVAREITCAGNVFTTHTPVPAGFDLFPPDLMERYFAHYWKALGISREQFLGLGREGPTDPHAFFNMALLAIRLAGATNAVSRLHASVSRRLLGRAWPGVPESDVPVQHVTNGVHFKTWLSRDMRELLQRYMGERWLEDFIGPEDWKRVLLTPDEELWRTHERRRERLVATVRRRLERQLRQRGAPRAEIEVARELLHPEALTIGFARRFAAYKRATLILNDPARFKRILCDKERPVQLVFAGKAHPHDNQGKELIRQIVHFARDPDIRRRVVFLEDYDMDLARYMVQGVDVWLNTPRRLMEASGTSGMKAAINGVINISILDGWWHEAYTPEVGWAIGGEELYDDLAYQDAVESRALYDLLEKEVIPIFFERGTDGLPRQWIGLMKRSMHRLGPVFNTRRMVREYVQKYYVPATHRWQRLKEESWARSKELAQWKNRIRSAWKEIRLESVPEEIRQALKVGDELEIQAVFHLGELRPEDLGIEIYYGNLDEKTQITEARTIPMAPVASGGDGRYTFSGRVPCTSSGRCGYVIRVLPNNPDLASPYELGLISFF
ncbi:MAG: alpha-glucan family phosphorylase [Planctomycetes bacterium]|nr:alpha-glucan family phosphorylase [Planctomycetota bacterium]